MANLSIKSGDLCLVIAGKDKGKTGKVLAVSPSTGRVIVEGVNIVSRHKKPRSAQDQGGIIKHEAPISASNVMVVCPKCNKATRVHHKIVDGKINKFYSEVCLVNQPWIRDDKTSFAKLKPNAKVKRFVRWEVGEEL